MTESLPFRPAQEVRIRGERWRVVRCLRYGSTAVVEVAGDEAHNRGVAARFLFPFETIEPLPCSNRFRVVSRSRWRHTVRHQLACATPDWAALRTATGARMSLLSYQLEPALAMLRGDGCRFLIADAVGLGKSVQAGLMVAELLRRWPDGRALVVTPAALRGQWRDELVSRFALDATVLDAPGIAALAARLPATLNPWETVPVAIASIDFVKRAETMRCLEPLVWDIVVFDEAHIMAGRSDRAAAASLLADRARIVVALTATPHAGDDEAFARLCRLGAASHEDALVVFRRTRAERDGAGGRRTIRLKVRPTAAERAMHEALVRYARVVWTNASAARATAARLAMVILMRRACSSAAALLRSAKRRLALLQVDAEPPQLTLPLAADDDEPGDVLGGRGLERVEDERAHLEWILTVAHDAASAESKLRVLKRLLRRTSEPTIVFTEYRDTLTYIADALRDYEPLLLHGGLTSRERQDVLAAFERGPSRLLLATDAASEGLNLHHRCRLVVNLELPWMPARLEQRTGRVDRIGQTRRVHAIELIGTDTSEQAVAAVLATRRRAAADATGWLERPLVETDVATAVIGEAVEPDTGIPPPPGVVRGDRRIDAKREADRIERLRRLQPAPTSHPESRPVATTLVPRRRARQSAGCTWGFRVLLTDATGQAVFESALGAVMPMTLPRSPNPRQLTQLLDTHRLPAELIDRLAAAAAADHARLATAVFTRWRQREQFVGERLRQHHGRLAALLLQGHLFDRYGEREAERQQAAMTAAGEQMAARLSRLTIDVAVSIEPGFALVQR